VKAADVALARSRPCSPSCATSSAAMTSRQSPNPSGEVRWRSAITGRNLRDMQYGALICEALERRVVGEGKVASHGARAPRWLEGLRMTCGGYQRGLFSSEVKRATIFFMIPNLAP
jgi:hypothetical protein